MTDIITEVQDPVRAFVVECLSDHGIGEASIIWGNEDAPAPQEPYAALFFLPLNSPGQDIVLQTGANTAKRAGNREAIIDVRIFGDGALARAYRIESGEYYDPAISILQASNIAIFETVPAKDLSYVSGGKMNRSAGTSFSIRWTESEEMARNSIESVTVTGTIKSDSGRVSSVVVGV